MPATRNLLVTVKFPSKARITIMSNINDTLSYIKMRIEERTGVKFALQTLTCPFIQDELTNDRTLKSYNIHHRAFFHVNIKLCGVIDIDSNGIFHDNFQDEFGYRIWVSTSGGQQISFKVHPSDPVLYPKGRIEKWTGVPMSQQHLVHASVKLDGLQTMFDCSIGPGATVSMAVNDHDWKCFSFECFVKLPNEKFLTILVTSNDTVDYVRSWIMKEFPVPRASCRIVYGCNTLEDGKTLADYGIKDTCCMKVELGILGGMDQQQVYDFEDRLRQLERTRSLANNSFHELVRRVHVLEMHAEDVGNPSIEHLNANEGTNLPDDITILQVIFARFRGHRTNVDDLRNRLNEIELQRRVQLVISENRLRDLERAVDRLLAGQAISAIGSSHDALSIASFQMNMMSTESINTSLNHMTEQIDNLREADDRWDRVLANQQHVIQFLQAQVASLIETNERLETRINSMTARAPHGHEETGPSCRRVLPASFRKRQDGPYDRPGLRGGMQIFVKTFTGKTIVINDINPTDTIFTLKQSILNKIRYIFIQPDDIRLIFRGRQLNNINSLSDYNINSGNRIFFAILPARRHGHG